ncbi:MAG: hypothetical protein ACRDRL_11925, partial [Sciscionella sp.]
MRRPSNPARDASRTAAPGAGPARSLAVGVVVVCLAVAGCATAIQGTPTTALDTINTTDVGGLPITDGPNGPRAGVPAATLPLRGGTDGAMDRLAVDSLADIYRYWRQAMPADFGNREFHAPTTLHSYDSRVAGPKLCGQPSEGLVNAFYCANDNSVSWDRGRLLPLL